MLLPLLGAAELRRPMVSMIGAAAGEQRGQSSASTSPRGAFCVTMDRWSRLRRRCSRNSSRRGRRGCARRWPRCACARRRRGRVSVKPSWAARKLTVRVRGAPLLLEDVGGAREAGGEIADRCGRRRASNGGYCRGRGRSIRGSGRGSCRAGSRRGRYPRVRRSGCGRPSTGSCEHRLQASRPWRRKPYAVRPMIGREVEAEAVYAGMHDEMAERVEHELGGPRGGRRPSYCRCRYR